MRTSLLYIVCTLGCVASGGLAALAGGSTGAWYASLAKPAWTPPGSLFGPVWTILYATMGVALAGVIDKAGVGRRRAVTLFGAQLALNLLWPVLFFRFHAIGLALVDLVALWILIGWTIAAFWSARDWCGALLLPYWAWSTFALALNAAIWRMNA